MMKLIRVTGSVGKTSMCEMIYQYLLYKGKKVSLYSSNGLFKNNTTKYKDYLRAIPDGKSLVSMLKEDLENGVEYAVIEITAEIVKRGGSSYTFKIHGEISGISNQTYEYTFNNKYSRAK